MGGTPLTLLRTETQYNPRFLGRLPHKWLIQSEIVLYGRETELISKKKVASVRTDPLGSG